MSDLCNPGWVFLLAVSTAACSSGESSSRTLDSDTQAPSGGLVGSELDAGPTPGAGSGKAGGGMDGSVSSGGSTSTDEIGRELESDPESAQGMGGASSQPPAPGQLTAGIFDDNLSFSFFETYRDRALKADGPPALPFSWQDFVDANDAYSGSQTGHADLEIALMLDTTGSMGDELDYLKSELDAIATSVAERFPQASQRWALVVYRDVQDAYLTREFDFTSDLEAFTVDLAAQTHAGGGDFPEAPEVALNEVNQLSWSTGDVARMVFWVADAPHRDQNAETMAETIFASQKAGLHIYPIASSGVDETAEFTMRAAAQLTHGRYLFLTEDSGIGGSHKQPTVPCYYVTLLGDAMLRAIDAEMTGKVQPPDQDEVIRTGGLLTSEGACKAEGAQLF